MSGFHLANTYLYLVKVALTKFGGQQNKPLKSSERCEPHSARRCRPPNIKPASDHPVRSVLRPGWQYNHPGVAPRRTMSAFIAPLRSALASTIRTTIPTTATAVRRHAHQNSRLHSRATPHIIDRASFGVRHDWSDAGASPNCP